MTDTVAALDAGAERASTPCAGGTMAWRLWGAGPPLVLLHGASGSWTHWVRNIAPLATRFRVLAADMPGFGDSAPPRENTAESLADTLALGLDLVVPSPAPLDMAGFSFGGIVGGLVAGRLGARVRTLVVIGSGGLALPAETPPLRRRPADATEAQTREIDRENLARLMFGDAARADERALDLHVENVRRTRFKSGDIPTSDTLLRALPTVKCRLAGLWGGRDAYCASYLTDRRRVLATFQPGLDFRVIEGAGHWVIYEAADAANRALLEMLGAPVG